MGFVTNFSTTTVNMKGGKLNYEKNNENGLHVIAVGGFALPTNSDVLTFALSTNALLATPKKLYAACSPYSFNSYPCKGFPEASV